jgi:transposase
MEGTGGHGAGLSRHLLQFSELVVELDRPKRPARRNGAKSDPLDAIRAGREAMARPRCEQGWEHHAAGANAKRCQCC